MRRRDFLAASGAVALSASYESGCSPSLPDSRHIVATADSRAKYLAGLLQELCVDIGPRPYSSPEYLRATEIILREMKLFSPDAAYDPFTIDRWSPLGEQLMTINGEQITAFVYQNSPGTPPGGLSGTVRAANDRNSEYDLIDTGSGEKIALLIIETSPHARPRYYSPGTANRANNLPVAGIGSDDAARMAQAARDGATIEWNAQIKWDKDIATRNVVGTIPGESDEELVFLAHLDSMYTAPGANDNGATLILMLMWAHVFSGRRPKKTLVFIAPDGEEPGMIGAYRYVEKRKAAGTFGKIKFVFNFDSFTWGPDLILHSEDKEMLSIFADIKNELNIGGKLIESDQDGFWLDAEPFRDDNIRGLSISAEGSYVFDTCWHQAEDKPEHINVEWVENNFQIFTRFMEKVMEL
ncbi:M28 family metallopeptidase [Candidatus Latescibacterota bacterium]